MILAKSALRGSGFGVVSVTYDFWPKAKAAGQASEYFRSLMIFGKRQRRGSGFGVVLVTYDFWPKALAAGQASE